MKILDLYDDLHTEAFRVMGTDHGNVFTNNTVMVLMSHALKHIDDKTHETRVRYRMLADLSYSAGIVCNDLPLILAAVKLQTALGVGTDKLQHFLNNHKR